MTLVPIGRQEHGHSAPQELPPHPGTVAYLYSFVSRLIITLRFFILANPRTGRSDSPLLLTSPRIPTTPGLSEWLNEPRHERGSNEIGITWILQGH